MLPIYAYIFEPFFFRMINFVTSYSHATEPKTETLAQLSSWIRILRKI